LTKTYRLTDEEIEKCRTKGLIRPKEVTINVEIVEVEIRK